MTIPTGASPTDRLDVEVEVPPACGTKSLAGGYLMATRLREVLVAGGSPRKGAEVAMAQGPVMIGNAKNPADPKVGRVLGGGRVKKEYPYTLVLKDKRKSVRTAAILEKVVNERFHQSEAGKQKGAATAKTDGFLVLNVPPIYHQNQERFFRVVQLLPMVDTPALRASADGDVGQGAARSQDERRGRAQARRPGALGERELASGPQERRTPRSGSSRPRRWRTWTIRPAPRRWRETAVKLPKFRAYALAALAAMEQTAAHMKLRKLMDEADIELRYGAFNALRTLDPHDPSLGQVAVLDDPKTEEASRTSRPTPWRSPWRRRANGRGRKTRSPFTSSIRRAPGGPCLAVPAVGDRRVRTEPEAAAPDRAGHRLDSPERRRQGRRGGDFQDRAQQVRRLRRQAADVAGAGRGDSPGGQPGGDVPRDRGDPGIGRPPEEPARPAGGRCRADRER